MIQWDCNINQLTALRGKGQNPMTNQLTGELQAIAQNNGFSVDTIGDGQIRLHFPVTPQGTTPVVVDNARIYCRDYFLKTFGAVNETSQFEGFWLNPEDNQIYPDDVIAFWVDAPSNDVISKAKNLFFLAEVLCTLLNQWCIYIDFVAFGQKTSVTVNHPNPDKIVLAEFAEMIAE